MFFKTRLPVEQANFHHLVMDIAWYGIALPATLRFLSVYAIRLGASPFEVSLLTAMPAIGLLFASNFAEWWRRRYPDTSRALALPAFIFRFVFILPAFTPFLPAQWQVEWLILSVTLPSLPQGIASIMFMVMIRESIPMPDITRLLGRREFAMNVTLGIAALAFGYWLEEVPFPYNYQAMFVLAFLFTMVSWQHCNQVKVIYAAPQQPQTRQSPWKSAQFLKVSRIMILTHIAFFAVFPLVPLRLVNDLNASEGFIALFAVAELGAAAGISTVASRIASVLGSQRMIGYAMIGTACGSLVVALSPFAALTLVAAILLGASWSLVTIGRFAYFSQHAPAEHIGSYTAAYNQVISVATFIGPMLGSGLIKLDINLASVLLIGAAARLITGLMAIQSASEESPAPRLRLKFR